MTQAHFMVDTETLALGPDAVILSLGACRFFWNPGAIHPAKFYLELDPEKQTTRKIDPNTLAWWEGRTNKPNGIRTLRDTVKLFAQYLVDVSDRREIVIWCRGTDFDIPKLYSMFAEADTAVPWKYYNVRDLRTLDKLFPQLMPTRTTESHNALLDSEYQAMHAATILRHLNIAGPGL